MEKACYELSHLDLHYLCGYPYPSTGWEDLTSVPTCDSSIWGRAGQNLLEDCVTVKDSEKPARLRLFHWMHEPYLGLRKSTAWRKNNKWRFLLSYSDHFRLVWVGACSMLTILLVVSIPFRWTVLDIDEYIQTINKRNRWLIFHNTILGRYLPHKWMIWDGVERHMSNQTRQAWDFIMANFRH